MNVQRERLWLHQLNQTGIKKKECSKRERLWLYQLNPPGIRSLILNIHLLFRAVLIGIYNHNLSLWTFIFFLFRLGLIGVTPVSHFILLKMFLCFNQPSYIVLIYIRNSFEHDLNENSAQKSTHKPVKMPLEWHI
jgi:hypothetical protein